MTRRKTSGLLMLSLLVTVLAVLAVPSPAPSSSAPAGGSQLKQIGHVEAHSACADIVLRANDAIGVALANDGDLALTINRLRTTDLDDDNELHRRNGTADLQTLTSRIRMAAATGNRDIKQLRAIVAQTSQPERKAELKAFTDALSGAIARQRIAATNLDKLLVIADGERATADANTLERSNEQAIADPGPMSTRAHPESMRPPLATPPPIDPMLRTLADDFQAQSQAILADEATAAEHTDGATTGC